MAEPKPWTLVGTRAERDFRIFTAQTLDVADPRDGTPYVRTVLRCPDWVNVIAVTADEHVVLVRQFRFGTWSNTLEIPGGLVDRGEPDVQTAALRELEEETGFVPERVTSLGWSHPNPAIQDNRLHTFLALDCRLKHEARPDPSEDLEVVLVPRAQLPRLVREGQITHALVLAALFLKDLASGHL